MEQAITLAHAVVGNSTGLSKAEENGLMNAVSITAAKPPRSVLTCKKQKGPTGGTSCRCARTITINAVAMPRLALTRSSLARIKLRLAKRNKMVQANSSIQSHREGGNMAKQTQTVSRSAKTGQFVTKHYADTHKATTVTERVKR